MVEAKHKTTAEIFNLDKMEPCNCNL
jgi:hypothetical protein